MRQYCRLALASVAIGCFLLQADLGADGKKAKEPEKKKPELAKDIVVNGELINVDLKDKVTQSFSKTYTFKMEKDKIYQIELSSNVFQPYLRLEDAAGAQLETGSGRPASIFHKAAKSEEYQVVVTSQGNSVGKFTLTIRDASASTIFTVTEKLNQNDAVYQGRKHKVFLVNMEAGKTYQIDMRSNNFDSYLYFESPAKKLLAQDDDSGGFPHARIVHKATETGKFRVIASHFGNGGNLGEFTITVRLTDGAPPRQPMKDGEKK